MKRGRDSRDERPASKTRRKRDSRSLQALGEALIDLKPEEIDALQLPARLRDAISDAQGIRSHEAQRRQRQYIGRLMREVDPEPIREFLERRSAVRDVDTRVFHAAESWRRRLLEGDKEDLARCAAALGIDEGALRDKVVAVTSADSEPRRKAAARMLFRALHEALATRDGGQG